jgi:hypothetical protein
MIRSVSVGARNNDPCIGRKGSNTRFDPNHIARHLLNTPQSLKLIQNEGAAHVFMDEATLFQVQGAVIENGQYTGNVRQNKRCQEPKTTVPGTFRHPLR